MSKAWLGAICLGVAALLSSGVGAQERLIPLDKLKSGLAFASDEVRGLQLDDEFASPLAHGIDKGAQLWNLPAGKTNKSCQSCHGEAADSMKGVATRYPLIDKASGKLFNVEDRIRNCRQKQQKALDRN